MMMNMRWNLETLFEGGSSSPHFLVFVQETETLIASLLKDLQGAAEAPSNDELLTEWTDRLQKSLARLREADAFVSCLTSQQMSDKRAAALTERIQSLSAKFKQAQDLYEAKLADVPEAEWATWSG